MKRKVLSVIMTGAMVAGLAGTVTVHAEEQQPGGESVQWSGGAGLRQIRCEI